MKNYSQKTVLKAIKDSRGLMQIVADRLGCEWHTAERYILKWTATQGAMQAEEERMKDFAQSRLFQLIEENDGHTIRWYLSRKAKDRGFGDEMKHEHGGTVKIQFDKVLDTAVRSQLENSEVDDETD